MTTRPTPDDVFDIVTAHAARRPMRTIEITSLCEIAYPHMDVTNDHVAAMLRRLAKRERVLSMSGEYDAELLMALGLPRPVAYEDRHARYWMLPVRAARHGTAPPIPSQSTVDSGGGTVWPYPAVTPSSFQPVPMTQDGRLPFDVTDNLLEAVDGAVVNVTALCLGENRRGWYQRQGQRWVPVHAPGLATEEHRC